MSLMRATTVLALLCAASSAHAQGRVVNVYNWSDYIDASILEDFTAETGIRVVYDVYDSNEILETRLFAGSSGYDVVVPSAEFMSRQIQAGVFQPLDKSLLTNIGNMWPLIESQVSVYDPDNAYSVNYMWGTTGIGYNVARVAELLPDAPTDSWALVFDPANASVLAECGIDMIDAPNEIYSAALEYLGIEINTTDPADFARVEELLAGVRPYVRRFHNSEYINALANGDICLAVGFSGDVFQARDRAAEVDGPEVRYFIPREGALMWFDQMAIPADAPNVAEAHEFINFMMRPDIIARATDYVVYANGNLASQELIDPEIRNDPAVYPSDEILETLAVKLPYDTRTQRLVTRGFTSIRTGR